jgi:hypothetical protein
LPSVTVADALELIVGTMGLFVDLHFLPKPSRRVALAQKVREVLDRTKCAAVGGGYSAVGPV